METGATDLFRDELGSCRLQHPKIKEEYNAKERLTWAQTQSPPEKPS